MTQEQLTCELHKLVNNMKRHNFEDFDKIKFCNGLYVFFEKGNKFKTLDGITLDRIVRVGINTSDKENESDKVIGIKQRIRNHYKARSSVFARYVNYAFVNKGDQYKCNNKNEVLLLCKDKKPPKELRMMVSRYMIENMSFVIFRFDDKDRDERKWYESAMLSLLNAEQNDYFKKQAETHDWLGNYVPQHIPENSKYTIRPKTSKLWVSQELDKQDTHIFAHDDIIFLNKKAKEDEQWDANKSYLKVIK